MRLIISLFGFRSNFWRISCGLLPENELSKQASVKLSPITGGPEVDDSLETSDEGIFACGNVLHVHDLVDYVSEEAAHAGRSAAEFVNNGKRCGALTVLTGKNGVRYTVPQRINAEHMADSVKVRFRVADVYKNKNIVVYFDGKEVKRTKKRIMAPGEMEELMLTKQSLTENSPVKEIVIALED